MRCGVALFGKLFPKRKRRGGGAGGVGGGGGRGGKLPFRFKHPHWSRQRSGDVTTAVACSPSGNVIMAALGVIVDGLVAFWRNPAARQNLHWMFLLVAFVGSVAKELDLVPQTYFSHSRNAVNV